MCVYLSSLPRFVCLLARPLQAQILQMAHCVAYLAEKAEKAEKAGIAPRRSAYICANAAQQTQVNKDKHWEPRKTLGLLFK